MGNQTANNHNEKKGCCECIFCLSKCPECGSKNVSVRYQPEFEYSYSEDDNSIDIDISYERLEIICEDCYKSFTNDSSSKEYSPLVAAISDAIKLSNHMHVERKKNGEIELKHYTYEFVKEKV